MSELSDMELDAVCGGFFDFGNSVVQTNVGLNIGVAFAGLGTLGQTIAQAIGQSNSSNI